jgi:membrane-associated protease RseP (regulator of RpoE activity)
MRLTRPTFRLLGFGLGALTLGLLASEAGAQATGVTGSGRGWVGMSVYVDLTGPTRGTATITEVSDGSPAAKAGVKPGDILMTINGHGAQDQFGNVMMTLRAGDPVKAVLQRNGRRRLVQMTAVARPLEVASTPRWNISLGGDSMADVMFRAMDSLRLRLIQGGDGLLGVITVPGPDDVPEGTPATVRLRSVGGDPGAMFGVPGGSPVAGQLLPEVRPPFSFYVFRGDRTDSLRTEMDQLNQEIRGLRAQRSERLRQLAAGSPPERAQAGSDAELLRLNRSLDEAGRRASDLRSAMERVAKEEAQGQPGHVLGATPGQVVTSSFRPLAPYLLGQNRAAGAEVVNLRPELAEYFQVDGGVLVVDVPEGTPAAQAGIQPGDVLTTIDGRAIRNIQELRMGLSTSGAEPWRVTLVRKGRTLEVRLPR